MKLHMVADYLNLNFTYLVHIGNVTNYNNNMIRFLQSFI